MINHPRRSKAAISATPKAQPPKARHHAKAILDEANWKTFVETIAENFRHNTATATALFRTSTDPDRLWDDIYLGSLPTRQRQLHTCSCCRQFIRRYGNIVKIEPGGSLVPVMWASIPLARLASPYNEVMSALAGRVGAGSLVAGVHLTKETVWGTPISSQVGPGWGWTHMAVTAPDCFVHKDRLLTPGQKAAQIRENVDTVERALQEFDAESIATALQMFRAEALPRAEKFTAPLEWLLELHRRPKGRAGQNVIWRAVAVAPEGYCHPRASVIGPLLESIAIGKNLALAKREFEKMVHPLRYQRPQVAPAAGNIAAAEKLVEKLGIERSLHRRWAQWSDIAPYLIWREHMKHPVPTHGVFGHITPREKAGRPPESLLPGATNITWEKFSRTIMPHADAIDLWVPPRGRFTAFTAASHHDAPPILKWDSQDQRYRNTVAWYCYHNGSTAVQWGLQQNTWARINGIVPFPTMWGEKPKPHLGEGVLLVIDGAQDQQTGQGNALFPECLIQELYAARSTIEAYSRSAQLEGRESMVAGYDVRCGENLENCTVRVLANGLWSTYNIDRWD